MAHIPLIKETIQINSEDIRLVIGKGGETIQKITGELGVEIDIEDSGLVFVTAPDGEKMAQAREWIEGIVAKPEEGKVYDCKVVRIIDGVGAIINCICDASIHQHSLAMLQELLEKTGLPVTNPPSSIAACVRDGIMPGMFNGVTIPLTTSYRYTVYDPEDLKAHLIKHAHQLISLPASGQPNIPGLQ